MVMRNKVLYFGKDCMDAHLGQAQTSTGGCGEEQDVTGLWEE